MRAGQGPLRGLHREESESKLSRMEATKGLRWGTWHDPMDNLEGSLLLPWGEWAVPSTERRRLLQS